MPSPLRFPNQQVLLERYTIMADENKNYFEFLDIPDGSGNTERWYATDAEARAAIEALPNYASVATCESIIDELT